MGGVREKSLRFESVYQGSDLARAIKEGFPAEVTSEPSHLCSGGGIWETLRAGVFIFGPSGLGTEPGTQ